MNKHLTPEVIRTLTVGERLQLIEDLWVSLDASEIDALPMPDWHGQVVGERLAAHARDPLSSRPWIEVKAEILSRLRK
jgi:putative addiction module component (TIGR02574 family)